MSKKNQITSIEIKSHNVESQDTILEIDYLDDEIRLSLAEQSGNYDSCTMYLTIDDVVELQSQLTRLINEIKKQDQ